MNYDGTTPLQPALAKLVGLSVKSQAKLAGLVKEAKTALGIDTGARILPPEQRLAIYQWHRDRLNPVQNIKQDEAPNPEQQPDSPIYNVKQDKPGQVDDVYTDSVVYDVKQDTPLTNDGDNNPNDFGQIHFAIQVENKRTTVMLEGYLVKALQRKHGLTGNGDIRAWIGQAIKADSRFDSHAPLTRQVKRLVVESFV